MDLPDEYILNILEGNTNNMLRRDNFVPWSVRGVTPGEAGTLLIPESWGVLFVLAVGKEEETTVSTDVQIVDDNPLFDMLLSAPVLYALNAFVIPQADQLCWQGAPAARGGERPWHSTKAM